MDDKTDKKENRQLLHFVFGGELEDLQGVKFRDMSKLEMVGIYPNYKAAHNAWKARSQQTVDNAHMRYFIVHMHRLFDPKSGPSESGENTLEDISEKAS